MPNLHGCWASEGEGKRLVEHAAREELTGNVGHRDGHLMIGGLRDRVDEQFGFGEGIECDH